MGRELNQHLISPERVIRGSNAWEEGKDLIYSICKRPLLLGRSNSTRYIRENLFKDLLEIGLEPTFAELEKDCCQNSLVKITEIFKEQNCDGIIASGGGKVLDAGKLLGERIDAPCITIPLSAATCAGWTALSNIYSCEGQFIKDAELKTCPKLLIFDHKLISSAPKRTLASGIADALAKWYEASISSQGSTDGLVQQAVQMARVLRDQLLLDGSKALMNTNSNSWIRVAEGCGLTAGLIGGIGGRKCRTAAAHALHNGLTQLKFDQKALHGELVGFGILVQLQLEEKNSKNKLASQSRLQLVKLLKEINLPITFKSLGLQNLNKEDLYRACQFACREGSEIYNLPFKIDSDILMSSIIETNKENQQVLDQKNKEISLI